MIVTWWNFRTVSFWISSLHNSLHIFKHVTPIGCSCNLSILHMTRGLFLHAYEVSRTAVDFYATTMLWQPCPPKIWVLATGLQILTENTIILILSNWSQYIEPPKTEYIFILLILCILCNNKTWQISLYKYWEFMSVLLKSKGFPGTVLLLAMHNKIWCL